mgnify:FL=1
MNPIIVIPPPKTPVKVELKMTSISKSYMIAIIMVEMAITPTTKTPIIDLLLPKKSPLRGKASMPMTKPKANID